MRRNYKQLASQNRPDSVLNGNQPMIRRRNSNEPGLMDKERRKRNIIIYGLEEFANETKWKTALRVMSLLAAKLQINIGMHYIDNSFWVGRKKQNRSLLIKFTTCMAKSEIMYDKHRLKGTKLRI